MTTRSPITTHVLDTSLGRPAAGVGVALDLMGPQGEWQRLATGQTNADGRWFDALPPGALKAGRYRLVFAIGPYFSRLDAPAFFPEAAVDFEVIATDQHYHVPLLVSPFGYSTYRGS